MDINKLLNLEKCDESYKASVIRAYDRFIKYSELPIIYKDVNIDIDNCSRKIVTLYENTEAIIDERLNIIFSVNDYSMTGYLSSMILHKYFKTSILEDNLLTNILYIDTNLLLDDYKKLIDQNQQTDVEVSLAHTEETIFKHIETAPVVIWDRFSMINSSYDKQKIYNILLIRYRNGLGNIYFMKDAPRELSRICDKEMANILTGNGTIVDLGVEQIKLENIMSGKGQIKW